MAADRTVDPSDEPAGDARFEDALLSDRPLRLGAESTADLEVISSLMQDAVGRTGDIVWARARRRLALVCNRFRWEDRGRAERERRAYERVRSALTVSSVMAVRSRGVDPADAETILSVLSVTFEPKEDGAGVVRILLAGDGELVAEVECLDVMLHDLTKPWEARSGTAPDHEG